MLNRGCGIVGIGGIGAIVSIVFIVPIVTIGVWWRSKKRISITFAVVEIPNAFKPFCKIICGGPEP